MKITRLRIKNYRGIEALDVAVAPGGALVKGRNASGKTSVLKAIRAALIADDVDDDSIRLGADSSEILVDLDALAVRRSIRKGGATVQVTTEAGDKWAKPQTRLNDLLGTSALDPLEFFLADETTKRKLVLEAIPLRLTQGQLDLIVGEPGAAMHEGEHALATLSRLERDFRLARTAANREASDADTQVAVTSHAIGAMNKPTDGVGTPAEAAARVSAASKAIAALEARREAQGRAEAAASRSLEKIAGMRAQAVAMDAKCPPAPTSVAWSEISDRCVEAARAVADLKERLAAAEMEARDAEEMHREMGKRKTLADNTARDAADLRARADDLETTIETITSVDQADWDAAVEAHRLALTSEKDAIAAAAYAVEARALEQRRVEAAAAKEKAERLDRIVKRLANVAPGELAKMPEMIPGLTFTEHGVALDGVSVSKLSGAEQLEFAVDLARRANAKAKILVCDGLERLDDERMAAFVKHATRDNWQLLGTRVASGELTIEAIEP